MIQIQCPHLAFAVALIMLLPCSAWSSENKATKQATAAKVETAVEAYDKSDAKPVENWFGCPPIAKGDDSAQENESLADDCAPRKIEISQD